MQDTNTTKLKFSEGILSIEAWHNMVIKEMEQKHWQARRIIEGGLINAIHESSVTQLADLVKDMLRSDEKTSFATATYPD